MQMYISPTALRRVYLKICLFYSVLVAMVIDPVIKMDIFLWKNDDPCWVKMFSKFHENVSNPSDFIDDKPLKISLNVSQNCHNLAYVITCKIYILNVTKIVIFCRTKLLTSPERVNLF